MKANVTSTEIIQPQISRYQTSTKDKRVMLKVKLKSLMEEARIIRKEEARSTGDLREDLHIHRTMDVRSEARHTHLAYGFIRGVPVQRMECPELWDDGKHPKPDWTKVRAMLKKYGPKGFVEPEIMKL